MTLALPGSEPHLIAWHDQAYPRSEALIEFPYFNELPSKIMTQEDSFKAMGEAFGWSYHALSGGALTLPPTKALADLQAILADSSQFVGFYNYYGFFGPFVAKFCELLGADPALAGQWDVCDLAWIYKAYLLDVPAEELVSADVIPGILALKNKGGVNITALATALELAVPKGVSYAHSDWLKVKAVYDLVFSST